MVIPERVERLANLPEWLASMNVDLRPVPDLRALLARLSRSGLHVSVIRLRNAANGSA